MIRIDKSNVITDDIKRICSETYDWHSLSNKTILITGASGFIGSYLVKTFLYANQRFDLSLTIICVVKNKKSLMERLDSCLKFSNLLVFEQDMSLPLKKSFPSTDILIHAASKASPKYYGIDPIGTLSANISGTMNLLNFYQHNIEKFIYISSGEVYGELADKDSEIKEDTFGYLDPVNVRSCYGESKRMSENICISFTHQYGIDTRIVRPFHTYGPGLSSNDGRVFADFIHAAANGNDICMTSDGSARRPFCYISDAVGGILHVMFYGKQGNAYNLANPAGEISIKELAKIVVDVRPELNINVVNAPQENNYLKSPVSRQIVNIEKLKLLGWHPKISVKDGFSRSIFSEVEALMFD